MVERQLISAGRRRPRGWRANCPEAC